MLATWITIWQTQLLTTTYFSWDDIVRFFNSHCLEGDRVYFTIGNNQEEGVVESVDYRDDGVAMATIRYELKSNAQLTQASATRTICIDSGEISHIHRNVEKLEPVA
ncbi:uncharacterized protein UTRI_03294_B [Ustilago trichophora]|uniref:Uncharacterized protein n=1 Tax=Ustilago trichophora TaxID=86804 RepID=A0A5C3E7L9_9BASI|nr:uncharacterized protein UTRI_03294_B [Ustilago trichophora]